MYRLAALLWRRLATTLGWTRSSYFLMSGFLATLMVIGIIWWPLARDVLSYVDWSRPLWLQVDWLLLSIFATMSLLIMAGADLQADALIVFVGLVGGLVIESWGTQTELWDLVAGAAILARAGGELRYLSGRSIDYVELLDGRLAAEPVIAGHPDLLAELPGMIRARSLSSLK
jgi:hypothetical protein